MNTPAFTHEEAQDLIGPLADGELPDALAERTRAHVAACPRCTRAVSLQQSVRSKVASRTVEPPSPALLLRVTAALDAEERSQARAAARQRPHWMRRAVPWSGWAVAAALVAVMLSPMREMMPPTPSTPPMVQSALVDYRRISREVLPAGCRDEGRPDLPFAGAPLRAPGVRPVSCWRTTLQGEAVSAWAYRSGNRIVVAYVVPEALFFRQPQVRDAVAHDGRYTTSVGDASVVAWPAERNGVVVVGDVPVSELEGFHL
jgi:anti-sigma factor RsiW